MPNRISSTGGSRISVARSIAGGVSKPATHDEGSATRQTAAPSGVISDIVRAGPPIDAAKVSEIKTAIAGGNYPVDPEKIADSMMALDMPDYGQWHEN